MNINSKSINSRFSTSAQDILVHDITIETFSKRISEITTVYEQSFGGHPFFVKYEKGQGHEIISKHMLKPGFKPFLAHNVSGRVVGALWSDTPSLLDITSEWGEQLSKFAYEKLIEHGFFTTSQGQNKIVWEREIFIDPAYQGNGIGTQLRMRFHNYLEQHYPEGTLLLVRMRDDNVKIITIAEKIGYQRTYIKTPSRNPDITNDFWFKLINHNRK
ncbi:MAG TPA: GNAT family N-acetyltransferase [Candidatus Saccharimonadales bacterium]|nr:GNAT family N-acetyltransferase [Candidatus Saccharimonadales bacterium]